MADLRFEVDWISYPEGNGHEDSDATARLSVHAGPFCLTRNENAWSEKIEDGIVVSLYPLAEWLAWSWWRLGYEPLPVGTAKVSHDWRMAHEMAAANAGIVWPTVVFATDGEAMQIWADTSIASEHASARYIVGTPKPVPVPIAQFQEEVSRFLGDVLQRLSERGKSKTGLAELWGVVQSDMHDESVARMRRMEARMGYDPDECPKKLLKHAAELENRLGEGAFAELAPAYSRQDAEADVGGIGELIGKEGLSGTPQINGDDFGCMDGKTAPWQRAVTAARGLRARIGMDGKRMDDSILYGLLGLSEDDVVGWSPTGKAKASIAKCETGGRMIYVSRKKHPVAKRFEFARFIADEAYGGLSGQPRWLVATDLYTSRQKFQRAFAAELLCPIDSLVESMEGDFSETSIEDAADYFSVSEYTVSSLLMNNGYIPPEYPASRTPYSMGGGIQMPAP